MIARNLGVGQPSPPVEFTGFGKVDVRIYREPLSANAKHLYAVIVCHIFRASNQLIRSHGELADLSSLSKRAVSRALVELADAGHIIYTPGGGRYKTRVSLTGPLASTVLDTQGRKNDTPGPQIVHPAWTHSPPINRGIQQTNTTDNNTTDEQQQTTTPPPAPDSDAEPPVVVVEERDSVVEDLWNELQIRGLSKPLLKRWINEYGYDRTRSVLLHARSEARKSPVGLAREFLKNNWALESDADPTVSKLDGTAYISGKYAEFIEH